MTFSTSGSSYFHVPLTTACHLLNFNGINSPQDKSYTCIHSGNFTSDTNTHPFNSPFSGTAQVGRYQKSKTNLDLTEARDSGISWAICKSAPCSRQIIMPAAHHSVFYRPDALPAAQPTVSKHCRHKVTQSQPIIHVSIATFCMFPAICFLLQNFL